MDSTPSNHFEVVVTFGLIMIIINGLCAVYMLSRTVSRWFITKKSLPMAFRVPFYIASSDFIIFSINFPNMVHSNIYGVVWEKSVCKIIGGFTTFAITLNMTLVGSLAFLTYLRICQKMYIDLGKYDYKGIIFVVTSSLIYSIVCIPSYDSGKYWCFTNTTAIRILPILTLVLNFVVLIVTIFSYAFILREINSLRFINEHSRVRVTESEGERITQTTTMTTTINENDNNNNNNNDDENVNKNFLSRTRNILSRFNGNNRVNDKRNKIEPLVVRKIIGYVLIFIIQWALPMVYVLGQIINFDPFWVYIVTDATVNAGGIGNMIQFIINEGWRDHYNIKETSDNSYEPPPPHRNIASDETIEINIKIDIDTSMDLDNYFSKSNEKSRPYSSSSTITKVSEDNNNTFVDINPESKNIIN